MTACPLECQSSLKHQFHPNLLQHRDRLKKLEEQSITINNNLNVVETLQTEVQNIKRLGDRVNNLEEKTNEITLVTDRVSNLETRMNFATSAQRRTGRQWHCSMTNKTSWNRN